LGPTGASLATAVGFLVWFHRAYTNLPALGIEPLPYATGWTIGAWLVPLLNLVRPKQIMDTIWRGSDPDRPPFDPFWHRARCPSCCTCGGPCSWRVGWSTR
jgi:Domain of unknown function (DUF4328)